MKRGGLDVGAAPSHWLRSIFTRASICWPCQRVLLIRAHLLSLVLAQLGSAYPAASFIFVSSRPPPPLPSKLSQEINRVRKDMYSDSVNGLVERHPLELPEAAGPIVHLQEKLFVPVKEYPDYNFVGRILGPRGLTAKQLEAETGCKIMVRGKSSMRDKKKEEQNRGKPNWEHLNEDLHVLISVEDTQGRAEIKMRRAVEEVKKLLVPAVSPTHAGGSAPTCGPGVTEVWVQAAARCSPQYGPSPLTVLPLPVLASGVSVAYGDQVARQLRHTSDTRGSTVRLAAHTRIKNIITSLPSPFRPAELSPAPRHMNPARLSEPCPGATAAER
uniref:K Homology domain-containing protein n=1 Tax=Knipowitschia caucasica TaxID=637954 RepID=A0AAV2JFU3_KNICA